MTTQYDASYKTENERKISRAQLLDVCLCGYLFACVLYEHLNNRVKENAISSF